MSTRDHTATVTAQFGPRAAAYVTSAVHAAGEDLDHLARLAAGMRRSDRVLDLGSGGGHAGFTVAPHVGQVVACDLSVEMLNAVAVTAAERGLGNIATRQARVEALPFPDGAFDAAISRYSAHHWQDFRAGLAEARRVLKPGGKAVFIDSAAPASALLDTHLQAIELLRDPSHVRSYSAAEWCDALAKAGLAVGTVSSWRIRLDFASWIARMRTPPERVAAIRAVQSAMPREVRDYLALEEDGSFTIETMTFEAEAA
jgi:SAM-dependent methyltransferase